MVSNIIPTAEELEKVLHLRLGKNPNVTTRKDIFIRLFGAWYIIPKGFTSDGASLPWGATWLFSRLDSTLLLFSILHDYYYRTQFIPRHFADYIYMEGLGQTASPVVGHAFYYILRIAGGRAWRKNKEKGLEKFDGATERITYHINNLGEQE